MHVAICYNACITATPLLWPQMASPKGGRNRGVLLYTDVNDVWSIEQWESSPLRGSIWLGAGDAGGSDVTGHGGRT